jgi:hypothetical protein
MHSRNEWPGRDRYPLPGRNDLGNNTVSTSSTTPNALRNRRFRRRQNRGVQLDKCDRLPLENVRRTD